MPADEPLAEVSAGQEPAGGGGRWRLLLLRHAKAFPAELFAGTDHDRPLAEQGLEDARQLGAQLRTEQLRPEVALVSSAVRTRQSWDALALPLKNDAAPWIEAELFLADADMLRRRLARLPEDCRTAILVGHNPGLHELAYALAHRAGHGARLRSFPTCALAEFALGEPWRDGLSGDGAPPVLSRLRLA
ncbi:SixA phosphatase family protein [Rhizosaccharibacter radicis]|uniref:Histidine phosphatase family protein n=1 Tax=Rhizosaccharibacter radicis TaxID=2782605 RepID=A0ABT1VU13_9PROT|nr:histidine phosphatase family protein [Acetobacteraceae bacterium KSS12]